jgi:hypothetical protein
MVRTTGRRCGLLAVGLALVAAVSGCGSEPVAVASGEIDGQLWQATVSTQFGQPGVCLMIHSSWRGVERLCGLDDPNLTWTVDATAEGAGVSCRHGGGGQHGPRSAQLGSR